MFLWEDYENRGNEEESEKISKLPDSAEIANVYKEIKKIDGIDSISINKEWYGASDDGRKKIRVSLKLEEDADCDEILKKMFSCLGDIYNIEIENLNDDYSYSNGGEKNDKEIRVELKLCKKFGTDRIEMIKKMASSVSPIAAPMLPTPDIKITSLTPSEDE